MRGIISIRGLLFIWIIFTGCIALTGQLRGLATELRNSSASSAKQIDMAFDWVNEKAIDVAKAILQWIGLGINSDVDFKFVIEIKIPVRTLVIVTGALVLFGAVSIYRRALRSPNPADDFIALFLLYFLVVTASGIALGLGFDIQAALQRLPVFWVFAITIAYLSMGEGALDDSRLFFRSSLSILILALVLFPAVIIVGIASALDSLATIAESLRASPNGYLLWALAAILLAIGELYAIKSKPSEGKQEESIGDLAEELEIFKSMVDAKRRVKASKKKRKGFLAFLRGA